MKLPNVQKLTIQDVIPENTWTEEAKNQLNKFKQNEKTVDRENLVYRTNKYTYRFTNFWTINTFGRDNDNGTIIVKEPDKDDSSLLVEIMYFTRKVKPQNPEKNNKKQHSYELICTFWW